MNETSTTVARLSHVRQELADAIERGKHIQEMTTFYLKRHFETIPSYQVLNMFISLHQINDFGLIQIESSH